MRINIRIEFLVYVCSAILLTHVILCVRSEQITNLDRNLLNDQRKFKFITAGRRTNHHPSKNILVPGDQKKSSHLFFPKTNPYIVEKKDIHNSFGKDIITNEIVPPGKIDRTFNTNFGDTLIHVLQQKQELFKNVL